MQWFRCFAPIHISIHLVWSVSYLLNQDMWERQLETMSHICSFLLIRPFSNDEIKYNSCTARSRGALRPIKCWLKWSHRFERWQERVAPLPRSLVDRAIWPHILRLCVSRDMIIRHLTTWGVEPWSGMPGQAVSPIKSHSCEYLVMYYLCT